MKHGLLAITLALVATMTVACDSAAITTLRLRIPQPATQGSQAGLAVAGASQDAIVAAVNEVAIAHGLQKTGTLPEAVISFGRSWSSNRDGHARLIVISVLKRKADGDPVRVEVYEWLAFGHSHFGKAVLGDLRNRLSQEFGADSLF